MKGRSQFDKEITKTIRVATLNALKKAYEKKRGSKQVIQRKEFDKEKFYKQVTESCPQNFIMKEMILDYQRSTQNVLKQAKYFLD